MDWVYAIFALSGIALIGISPWLESRDKTTIDQEEEEGS